jgi:glutaredoxin
MQVRVVLFGIVLASMAGAAAAQLYRWTDEKGRVHITDTPPPASAKGVQKKNPAATGVVESQTPFEVTQAAKNFPVTLYTSPNCKEPCDAARATLNKRGVPFKEVQVWEEQSNEELKRVSGGNDVPTLVVGRSVHRGFEPDAYDALLDSARYPKAGLLTPRAQAAPAAPEGYVDQGERRAPPAAEPVKPEPEAPAPTGPYAPKAPRSQNK